MAKLLKIAPTKSNLLLLTKRLAFLEQGHSLLERKKELLTRLVYERLAEYRKIRSEVQECLPIAYTWLSISHLRLGRNVLGKLGVGLQPALQVDILAHSQLGVQYPKVSAELQDLEAVALMGTDTSFDETRIHLARLVQVLARFGETETTLWRLLEEQRKTQKRVNALKYNIIPRYHQTIRTIRAGLDEEERNTLFQIQRLREQNL